MSNQQALAIDDCWKRIGIHGDASCQELITHIHCRNCPVYSRATMKLLDRDLSTDYLDDWTRHIAHETKDSDLATQSVVIFRIGVEWLALTSFIFDEVVDLRPIHSLPQRRNGVVLGLVNVRGGAVNLCFAQSNTPYWARSGFQA